jgi:protein tyrosine/serine phosphatase
MRKSIIKLIILVLLVAAAITLLIRHFHINDFAVIEPGALYTSGQPRRMDYTRLLYRYHIATIVNIRQRTEHINENWHNEEIVWARNNGVHYIEMPIEKESFIPDEKVQNDFLSIMADKNNLPVLLHGGNDDKRVAMLVAVWLLTSESKSVSDIVKSVKKIIDDRELTIQEIDFINQISRK